MYYIIICSYSCSTEPNIIYYRYNDQIVTRFNDYPKDYFLLGKHTSFNDTLKNTFIKTSFRGFDGFMSGYMVFKANKTVKIIRIADSFEKFGNNDSIDLIDFSTNSNFMKWKEKADNDFSNIVELSDGINTEKRVNKEQGSKVNVDYGNIKAE